MLKRNVVHLQRNIQPRGGFEEESYRRKEKQIMQRAESQNFREGAQNNQRRQELERDSNTMDVDRGREGDRTCYIYRKWNPMAKNCWQRKEREEKVVEML